MQAMKHWKIYLALVGKNGISKMVLRETLPLINGELRRLLTDVCDFDVEVAQCLCDICEDRDLGDWDD